MIFPETFEVARLFRDAGLRYWIFGGNGVELVIGGEVRPHDDLDVFIAAEDAIRAVSVLEGNGFSWHAGSLEAGDVFLQRDGLLLDLVPIDDTVDPPCTLGKLAAIELPRGFLTPYVVMHAGEPIMTLTPAMHLAMKERVGAFYQLAPREKDLIDAERLGAFIGGQPAVS